MEQNLIDVKYEKNYGRNQMIISPISPDNIYIDELRRNFRVQMIQENNIDGLLNTDVRFINDIPHFYYDISGLQSLKVILESTLLSYELLSKIFIGLYNALISTEKYMLLYEHILPYMEYIFMSSDFSKVYFCYYPLQQQDFCVSTQHIFDELLKAVNHNDEKAVYLAYTIHKESLNEDFNLQRLLSCLSTVPSTSLQESPTTNYEPPVKPLIAEPTNEINTIFPASDNTLHTSIKSTFKKDTSTFIMKMSVLGVIIFIALISITAMFILNFYDFKFFVILLFIIIAIAIYNGYMIFNLNAPSKLSSMIASQNNFQSGHVVPPDESSTVLLTPLSSDCIYRLIYTGADSRQDIELKTFPFVIGKGNTCDGLLSDPTISRMHAKIEQHQNPSGLNELVIEDLNSTNGTFLNNASLAPYNKTPLSPGDLISFGGITYMLR